MEIQQQKRERERERQDSTIFIVVINLFLAYLTSVTHKLQRKTFVAANLYGTMIATFCFETQSSGLKVPPDFSRSPNHRTNSSVPGSSADSGNWSITRSGPSSRGDFDGHCSSCWSGFKRDLEPVFDSCRRCLKQNE